MISSKIPLFAPLLNMRRCTLWNRDLSWKAWNRRWVSNMVDTSILWNNTKYPLKNIKCYYNNNILVYDHMQWHYPSISRYTESWPCYQTWLLHKIPESLHSVLAMVVASLKESFNLWTFCSVQRLAFYVFQFSIVCSFSGLWRITVFPIILPKLWPAVEFIWVRVYLQF